MKSLSKKIKVLIVAGVFFVLWCVLWKLTVSNIDRDMYQLLDTGEYHEFSSYSMETVEELQQNFKSKETVYAIDLYLEKTEQYQSGVHVCVRNLTDNLVLFDKKVAVEDEKTRIIVKDVKYQGEAKEYSITLMGGNAGVNVLATVDDLYRDGTLMADHNEQNWDIVLKVFAEQQKESNDWVFYLICTFVILVTVYLIWISKWKFEIQCAVLVLVIGLIYAVLFPPQTIHDEDIHIDVVYRMSNMLMGKNYAEDSGKMLMREGDLRIYQLTGRNSLQSHQYVKENFQLFNETDNNISIQAETLTQNFLLYFPQVLGMVLGRVLGLGCFPIFYLSKIMGILFYAGCVYYAVKITPIAKAVFAVTALLPMTLQQVAGITYDSSLNGVALLLTALCLKIAYGNIVSKKDWIITFIFALWLILYKRGVYCFILLLVLLYFKKKSLNINIKRIACVFFGLVGAGGVVLYINRGILAGLTQNTWEHNYTYSFVLQKPLAFIGLLWQTLILKGSFYIETMLGVRLAWDEIAINNMVIAAFGILLLVSVLHTEGDKQFIYGKDKIIFLGIILLVFGAIEVAALAWTSVDSEYIWGVLGRYFIPVLPILLLILDNFKLFFKKKQDINILLVSGLLHILVLFDISRFILAN